MPALQLHDRIWFQLVACAIWFVPLTWGWFLLAGSIWSPATDASSAVPANMTVRSRLGLNTQAVHTSLFAPSLHIVVLSATIFGAAQVLVMWMKARAVSATRTVALSRCIDVNFLLIHVIGGVLSTSACKLLWVERASAVGAAIKVSKLMNDGGSAQCDSAQCDGPFDPVAFVENVLVIEVNDVYPFVVIFVGVVIGLLDAFHFLQREEAVLRFPSITRARHLRIAMRWKPALVGAVKQAAALTTICVACIGGLAAIITLTDYGGEDLPLLALDLVDLSPYTFRKPADVRAYFAVLEHGLFREWDDDFALLSSVILPLVALALPIGVTTFFALRMGAAFVEIFLTNPLPQLPIVVAPEEELSALIDALRVSAFM